MLISKSARSVESGVVREGRNEVPEPALAITVSMCVTPSCAREPTRVAASVSDSLSRGWTRSLLPDLAGRDLSSSVAVDEVRTVAMTVVSERRRSAAVRPRPIPWRLVKHGHVICIVKGLNRGKPRFAPVIK